MDYEYDTVEDALHAVDVAVEETLADQPHLKPQEDSVYHDMVQAIALSCAPAIRAELGRRTGVEL